MRQTATGLVVVFVLECGAICAGLRYNGTHSVPEGFYLVTARKAQEGDLVLVDIPSLPMFGMAKARGYLNVAYSPTLHLIKRMAGVAGDRVTINSEGVEVNGNRLANSAPLARDGAGRPLHPYLLNNSILGPGEVLLMSDYNPASFDSRYFGPLHATAIQAVVKPLLTWN